MALTIFSGPHPLGGTRTVACPTWDLINPGCNCVKSADGSVPNHDERRWPADQATSSSVKEAYLLAVERYGRTNLPKYGDLDGLVRQ